MVGVPHSTGCSLCRERRIKCDKATPSCTQCLKYGRPCPGYQRTYRFQDERPGLELRHASSTGSNSSRRGRTAAAAAVVRDNALAMMQQQQQIPDPLQSTSEGRNEDMAMGTGTDAEPAHFPPPSTGPTDIDAFNRTVFRAHYYHNLFRLPQETDTMPGYIARNAGRAPFQDAAVACLTCIYRAHETGDQTLLKRSRYLYAQGLREVVAGLYGEEALSADMLSAIMMLAVYEMYARTSPTAWAVHVDGVRRLMRSRGAEGYGEEGMARSNYLIFRGFLVLAALQEGAGCFLEEEDWRAVSWGIAREDMEMARRGGGGSAAEWVEVEERVFGEVVRVPGLVVEARQQGGEAVGREIARTRQQLGLLAMEVRAAMEATAPRVMIAGATVVDRAPWLLVQGLESAVALLDALLARRRSDGFFRPFRVVCGLNQGPSGMPRIEGITWLDQVAASMGMIGTTVVDDS